MGRAEMCGLFIDIRVIRVFLMILMMFVFLHVGLGVSAKKKGSGPIVRSVQVGSRDCGVGSGVAIRVIVYIHCTSN
jgi:hypothetical protein